MRKTSKNKIKRNKTVKKRMFNENDYNSSNGFSTYVWGGLLWFNLHLISFNYPVEPTEDEKKHYKDFILNLQYILPCGICRNNLKRNFKILPLTDAAMKNRESFSRYVYNLHEVINKMLKKKSNLTYEDVRDRFENFRSTGNLKSKIKEEGCSQPVHTVKSKCIIKIVPREIKCDSVYINKKCMKK
jgi:hypothetical protein